MGISRTYLTALRLRLRPYWLALVRDVKMVFTPCRRCGEGGASPCSIAGCVPLCDPCQREESYRLTRRLNVKAIGQAHCEERNTGA